MFTPLFLTGNGTETSSEKTRSRRSAPQHDYGYKPMPYSYKPNYSYGYKPKPYYYPSLHYYQPNPSQTISLWQLFSRNPAFKNAFLGHHFKEGSTSSINLS